MLVNTWSDCVSLGCDEFLFNYADRDYNCIIIKLLSLPSRQNIGECMYKYISIQDRIGKVISDIWGYFLKNLWPSYQYNHFIEFFHILKKIVYL